MSARARFIIVILGLAGLIAAYGAEAQHSPADGLHREWVVEDVTGRGVPDSAELTMVFAPDGRVSGSSGCNRYSGYYTLAGERLAIGPVAMTRMACVPAVMDIERRFGDALEQAARVTLDKTGALMLSDADGKLLVVARPAQGR